MDQSFLAAGELQVKPKTLIVLLAVVVVVVLVIVLVPMAFRSRHAMIDAQQSWWLAKPPTLLVTIPSGGDSSVEAARRDLAEELARLALPLVPGDPLAFEDWGSVDGMVFWPVELGGRWFAVQVSIREVKDSEGVQFQLVAQLVILANRWSSVRTDTAGRAAELAIERILELIFQYVTQQGWTIERIPVTLPD